MRFALGPWQDSRYTYLLSSLALALPWPAALLAQAFQPGREGLTVAFYIAWALLHLILFPLAREFYFGLTEPVRRGLAGVVLWGPLMLALFVIKFLVYVALNVVAVPLGLVGYVYLAFRAHASR